MNYVFAVYFFKGNDPVLDFCSHSEGVAIRNLVSLGTIVVPGTIAPGRLEE